MCDGPYSIGWILFNYGCVILSQLVAVILAFRTRKVTIKALNDSKYLTIIIYSSAAIITVMIACALLLAQFLTLDAAVFGGLIMIFTTGVLGLTFIPKVSTAGMIISCTFLCTERNYWTKNLIYRACPICKK